MPLKLTEPIASDPKLLPVIMTAEPGVPRFGAKLVMLGAAMVRVEALLTRFPAVLTVTLPVIVPSGT